MFNTVGILQHILGSIAIEIKKKERKRMQTINM